MNEKPIRVVLVDDSVLALEMLSRILSSDSQIKIVAKISDPTKALGLIKELKPDIACIDYFMPNLSGLELTKKIMEDCPLPILIISGQLGSSNTQEIFSLLDAGALDFLPKPSLTSDSAANKKIIEKLHVLSKVFVIKKVLSAKPHVKAPTPDYKIRSHPLIVIGASTGGPVALKKILERLPPNFPFPIVCVQHMSNGFLKGFVDWIASYCPLKVKIIEPKEVIQPGHLYFSQEDYQLGFNHSNQMVLSKAPPVQLHRPSVDFTFSSAAEFFGKKTIAILLTGMGNDGAKGMLDVFSAGGITIAQNEASCVVFGMPKEAIEMKAVNHIWDLDEISLFLENLI